VCTIVTKIEKPITVQGEQRKEKLGLTHIMTGDGKGKTTSSLGLAMRAIGTGYNVYMIQFLKSGGTGEIYAAKHLPNLTIVQYGVDAWKEKQKAQSQLGTFDKDLTGRFVFQPDTVERDAAIAGFKHAKSIIERGEYDLVILDEVNCVIDKGFIPMQEAIDMLQNNNKTEIYMTGRDAPKELMEHVDYFCEIKVHKHPWQKGIKARKGIEY
jgi:cob(I)alamin adenosyltransferase